MLLSRFVQEPEYSSLNPISTDVPVQVHLGVLSWPKNEIDERSRAFLTDILFNHGTPIGTDPDPLLEEHVEFSLNQHGFFFPGGLRIRLLPNALDLGVTQPIYLDRVLFLPDDISLSDSKTLFIDVVREAAFLPLARSHTKDFVAAEAVASYLAIESAIRMDLFDECFGRSNMEQRVSEFLSSGHQYFCRSDIDDDGCSHAQFSPLLAACKAKYHEISTAPFGSHGFPFEVITADSLKKWDLPDEVVSQVSDHLGWRKTSIGWFGGPAPVQVAAIGEGVLDKYFNKNGVVNAAPGSRKSHIGYLRMLRRAYAPGIQNRRTIIPVATRELGIEKYEELQAAFGKNEARPHGLHIAYSSGETFSQDREIVNGEPMVTIAVYEKLESLAKNPKVLEGVGEILNDELPTVLDQDRGWRAELQLLAYKTRGIPIFSYSIPYEGLQAFAENFGSDTFYLYSPLRPISVTYGVYDQRSKTFTFIDSNTGERSYEYLPDVNNIEVLVTRFMEQTEEEKALGLRNNMAIALPRKTLMPALAEAARNNPRVQQICRDNADAELAIKQIESLEPSVKRDLLLRYAPDGISFLFADLDKDARRIVREAFKSGEISLLFVTTLLKQGVNFFPSCMVLKDMGLRIGEDSDGESKQTIDEVDIESFFGRAGRRKGHRKPVAIIIPTSERERKKALSYIEGKRPNFTTALLNGKQNEEKVLHATSSLQAIKGEIVTLSELVSYLYDAPSVITKADREKVLQMIGEGITGLCGNDPWAQLCAYITLSEFYQKDKHWLLGLEAALKPIRDVVPHKNKLLGTAIDAALTEAKVVVEKEENDFPLLLSLVTNSQNAKRYYVGPEVGVENISGLTFSGKYGQVAFGASPLGQIAVRYGVSVETCQAWRNLLIEEEKAKRVWTVEDLFTATQAIAHQDECLLLRPNRKMGISDVEVTRSALKDWLDGVPTLQIEQRYGLRPQCNLPEVAKSFAVQLHVAEDILSTLPEGSVPLIRSRDRYPEFSPETLTPLFDCSRLAKRLMYGVTEDMYFLMHVDGVDRTAALNLHRQITEKDPDSDFLEALRENEPIIRQVFRHEVAEAVLRELEKSYSVPLAASLKSDLVRLQNFYDEAVVQQAHILQGKGVNSAVRMVRFNEFAVMRRNQQKGGPPIKIESQEQFQRYQKGLVEILTEMGQVLRKEEGGKHPRGYDFHARGFVLDFDPKNDFSYEDQVAVVKKIWRAISLHSYVDKQKMRLSWSGGKGFHVFAPFKEGVPDNREIDLVNLQMQSLLSRFKAVGVYTEEQPNLYTPYCIAEKLKARQPLRNDFAIHPLTGFPKVPLRIEEIDRFDPTKATVENVLLSLKRLKERRFTDFEAFRSAYLSLPRNFMHEPSLHRPRQKQ